MAERIGIDIAINGYDTVKRQMSELDKQAKSLQAKDIRIKINGEVTNVADRIKELERNLIALKNEKAKIEVEGGNLKQVNREIRQTQAELTKLQAIAKNAAPTFGKTFSTYVSRINHLGAAFTQLGNAMVKFGNPMRTLLRGSLYGAGFALLNTMTSGLQGAAHRADIMSTYAPIMQSLGHSAEEANIAVDNLYEAVLGLPTGLDEIVEQHKLLTVAVGDVTKAEKLAIAANNAYIAGGAADNIVNIGQRELLTLAQTGELNARQWMALQKAIPTAWKEIQDNFRKTKGIDDLRSALSDGTIAAQDFLDELVKVGTTGQTAAVVTRMKHTFSAVTANIQNAFRRMGENIFKTLDEVFQRAYGGDTIDMLLQFKNGIDAISESIQGWIKANPEVITNFIDALKSVNWNGVVNGVLNGLAFNIRLISSALKTFGQGKGVERFFQFMAMSGFLGRGFLMGGGFIRGTRHLTGGIGAGVKVGVWQRIRKAMFGTVDMAEISAEIKAEKEVSKAIQSGDTLLGGVATSAPAVSRVSRIAGFSKGMIELSKGIFAMSGAVASVGGAGFLVFKSIKSMISDMAEISKIAGDVDWGTIGKISAWFSGAVLSIGAISKFANPAILGDIAAGMLAIELIVTSVAGFAALDTYLLKKTMQSISDALTYAGEIVDKAKGFSNYSKADFNKVLLSFGAISSLSSDLMAEYGAGRFRNIGEIKSFTKDMTKIVGNIASIFKAISSLNSAKGSTDISKFKTIMTNVNSLYEQIQKDFELWGSQNDTAKLRNAENVKKLTSNLKAAVQSIVDIGESLKVLADDKTGISVAELEVARRRMSEMGKKIADIYATFLKEFSGTVGDERNNGTIVSQTTIDNIGKMNEAIKGVGEAVSAMNGMVEGLNALKGANIPLVQDLLPKVSSIFDDIWNIYAQWKIKDFGTRSGGDNGMFANMTNSLRFMSKALDWINTIINQVATITGNGNAANMNIENVRSVFTNLRQIMSAFTGEGSGIMGIIGGGNTSLADVDASGFSTQMQSFASGIGEVKNIATELQGLQGISLDSNAISSLVHSISDTITQLNNAFNGDAFDMVALVTKINAFRESIDLIVQTLQTIGNSAGADGAITITVIFKKPQLLGLQQLLSELQRAKLRIQTALNSIRNMNTTISLSFYLNATVNDNLGSAFSSAASRLANFRANMASLGGGRTTINSHRGGFVRPQYRAKGGNIFKARGTDRVPAMLTAGEFVQNKNAVRLFGLDFMNKVNNLDIHGAMQALYARANGLTARSTNITNNVYNNINNTNNQTVYTNSPNFAYKRSKRALQGI